MNTRFFAIVALLFTSHLLFADTIRLRADYWYPFNGEPQDKNPGHMIEIAKTAWEQAGYHLDYQLMPWEESITKARAGEADCIVGGI